MDTGDIVVTEFALSPAPENWESTGASSRLVVSVAVTLPDSQKPSVRSLEQIANHLQVLVKDPLGAIFNAIFDR